MLTLLFFYHFSSFFIYFCFDLVSKKSAKESSNVFDDGSSKKVTESEFISDKFKATNERDLVEVQANMTKLGMTVAHETPADGKKNSPAGKDVT